MAKQNAIDNRSQDLTIDPGTSGDSFVQFDINGTGEFRLGVDDDAADSFKLASGNALGTTDTFIITAAGERTMPLQPAFLAYLSATASNVTGDNTTYTIIFNTEVFDQNGDYNNGTGAFTAAIDGRYQLLSTVFIVAVAGGGKQAYITINTSNRYIRGEAYPEESRVANFSGVNGTFNLFLSMLCDMDAADEATIYVKNAGGAKTDDVYGGSVTESRFSGLLIC